MNKKIRIELLCTNTSKVRKNIEFDVEFCRFLGILTDLEKKYEKVNQNDCVENKINEKITENDERMQKSPSMFESTLNSSQQSKGEEPIEEKSHSVSKFRVDAPPYQPLLEIPPG